MPYLGSREISAIALFAALWGVLNWTVAPIFWRLTHLPILCDMLASSLLILTVWWTRRLGAATLMGLVATLLNFILRPGALHFLGFTAASVVFDVATYIAGYDKLSRRGLGSALLVAASIISTFIAGLIIGSLFMNPIFLSKRYGGVLFFALLHAAGGVIGGLLGAAIVAGAEVRGVIPK